MVGTRRNFNFFLEDGFLSETLLLPSLPRTCLPLFPLPFPPPFPLNLVLVEGEGWSFARNGRGEKKKKLPSFQVFKTQGRKWRQRERKRDKGKGRRRTIRARHCEARYNAVRGSLHFLLPLRTLTNEGAEQAAEHLMVVVHENWTKIGCSWSVEGDGGDCASKTIR